MKLCVFGAGAIGGHLAVRLAQVPGNDVQVVARGPHLAAIREHGLALKLVDTPLHARVEASDRIADLPLPQLVFVTLKAGQVASDDLKEQLRAHVGKEIGSLAKPDMIRFAAGLPKTRSGKLLRRAIQAVCEGRDPGDLTTLDDPSALLHIKDQIA